jgi:hypothetical protein
MKKHRVNIVCAVNAANVSKDGERYTVRDVVHAIDGIVLNGRLYPGDELQKAANGLEGRPAPAGHPKDAKGRHISAANGEALSAAWVGAYCTNARYEGGRALCDIVINAAQAQALEPGRELLARLDAAIAGTNTEPISVSSGLMLREVAANGESRGKQYRAVATDLQFDHLAILLNEAPAGTPAEGIGMFVNADGTESQIEQARLDTAPADKRFEGIAGWLRRLVSNGADLSFEQIADGLRAALPEGAWPWEVYPRYCIWRDREDRLFRQDYSVSSDGSVLLQGEPAEVVRRVEYQPVTTNQQEKDEVKEHILAALNAAGVSTEGKTDAQLLDAYNAHVRQPVEVKLTAANEKVATFEAQAQAAQNAERDALAAKLAVNSSLTVEDLKLLPLERLKVIEAAGKGAAPVVVGNTASKPGASEWDAYDLNKLEA